MMKSGRPWLHGPNLSTDTSKISVRLRCQSGHPFKAEVTTCINTRHDRILTEELCEIGRTRSVCPSCDSTMLCALPVFIVDPDRTKTALFIPSEIAYLELHIRAVVQDELAENETQFPAYMGNCETLVGSQALKNWLELESSPRVEALEPKSVSEEVVPEVPEKREAPEVNKKVSILEAFADLDGEEEQRPSIIPEPDSEIVEDGDDDDWLDDSAMGRPAGRPKSTSFTPKGSGE